jgi:hypothetical protein
MNRGEACVKLGIELMPLHVLLKSGEAERASVAAKLANYEVHVRSASLEKYNRARILAAIKTRSGRYESALQMWKELDGSLLLADEESLEYAYCLARSGKGSLAKSIIDRVEVESASLQKLMELVQRYIAAGTTDAPVAAAHYKEAAAALWDCHDPENYVESALYAANSRGFDRQIIDRLDHIFRCMSKLGDIQDLPVATVWEGFGPRNGIEDGRHEFVLCCGFGWSGSGAVLDYLCQFPEFGRFSNAELNAFSNESTRYLKKIYGWERYRVSSARELVRAYFDYLSVGILGFVVDDSQSNPSKSARRSLLSVMSKNAEHVEAVFSELESSLSDVLSSPNPALLKDSICRSIAEYWRHVKDRVLSEGKIAILNNVMRSYNTPILKDMGLNLRVCAVTRDPRDQFVDIQSRSNRPMDVDSFVDSYRRQMKKHEYVVQEDLGPPIKQIEFESFVLDESVRKDVLSFVGVPEPSSIRKRKFSATESAKNIGLHNDWPRREEIEQIEGSLSEYIRE